MGLAVGIRELSGRMLGVNGLSVSESCGVFGENVGEVDSRVGRMLDSGLSLSGSLGVGECRGGFAGRMDCRGGLGDLEGWSERRRAGCRVWRK